MRPKNINICLLLIIFIIFIIIFVIYKNEQSSYYYTIDENTHIDKKNKNIDKKIEKFDVGYFPSTVYNLPESNSQNKQILDRLVYNYPSVYDDPYRYPNFLLPAQVIGCGSRRGACMGGSQVPIPNTIPPVNISEENIAPVNLTVRGFDEGIQQVGTIQKVFGKDNYVFPLFGRKRYRNDNKWEYFVKFGKYGVILPIIPLRNYEELNTNDEVYIQGQKDKYRVTI